jgi:uncharacterized protein YecT (DUF1311 family)
MNRQIKNAGLWTLTLMIGVFFATQSWADEEISIDCAKAMGIAETRYCAAESYRMADEGLNHAWQTFTKDLEPQFKQSLVEAQQTWVLFRNLNCDAETFLSRGGTGYIGFYDNCLERMTRHRTEELRTILEPN